jgi:hypothetical protein
MPHNNPIRKEIKQVVEHLGGRVSELAPDVPRQEQQDDVQSKESGE